VAGLAVIQRTGTWVCPSQPPTHANLGPECAALPAPPALPRSWMGWSGHVSVNPYTGLQFFNLKFKGQRVVYELALKVRRCN